ncbi:hypothetical protein TrCOL_g6969 [Triparma columacea]|uniref:hydroxyacylglutathione hydrolase n=1 Tax=Triparma columacea TaxID=722753 RepID=A0A9W7GKL0_9STRA|nr:hypothetical protein TrCOL_g6969 [Triparma columacea]
MSGLYPLSVDIIPILEDNYSYLATYAPGYAFLIDPADPPLVLAHLQSLPTPPIITHILTTHKHWDHAGGNLKIVETLNPTQPSDPITVVCGSLDSHPSTTLPCFNSDVINLPGGHVVKCVHTPAHTKGHMCYLVDSAEPKVVFTGDCMFKGGCGKLFEGSPSEMTTSLLRLTSLPPQTLVYPGHEYTVSNLEFAFWALPDSSFIEGALEEARKIREEGKPTVPSTVEYERMGNPFVIAAAGGGGGEGGGWGRILREGEEVGGDELLGKVREAKDKGMHKR